MWEDRTGPKAAQATKGFRSMKMTLEVLDKAIWEVVSGSQIRVGWEIMGGEAIRQVVSAGRKREGPFQHRMRGCRTDPNLGLYLLPRSSKA